MFPVFSVPSTILEAECELYIFFFFGFIDPSQVKGFFKSNIDLSVTD